MRTTGAVRDFDSRPVPASVIATALDEARFATSGGNRQPWKVAVLRDSAVRRQLAELMQPTWDEYVSATQSGQTPFNAVDYAAPVDSPHSDNVLIGEIESVPVVLAVAADLRNIVAFDADHDRVAVVPGASIYPFCWSVLLAAKGVGLGGVLTTTVVHRESEAGAVLGLPEHHALAALIYLGYPKKSVTRLRRAPVSEFATVDRFDGEPLAGIGKQGVSIKRPLLSHQGLTVCGKALGIDDDLSAGTRGAGRADPEGFGDPR